MTGVWTCLLWICSPVHLPLYNKDSPTVCICVWVCVCVYIYIYIYIYTFSFLLVQREKKLNILKWIGLQRDLYSFRNYLFSSYICFLLSSKNLYISRERNEQKR